jgi:Arc/MetJ-type ribon-helix-helix transcriptional regulator
MKPSITVKRKKRGRPATGTDPLVGVRFPPSMIEIIDNWGNAAGEDVTRSEAIRRLVELGLKAKGKGR